VWIGAALLLVFLMVLPLGSIFRASLWDETGFSLGATEVFTNAAFLKAIWNTVVISFLLGWRDLRRRRRAARLAGDTNGSAVEKPIRALVMASFVTPPFLGAFAWTLLAGPNAGALNKFFVF
jgi:iron(III) transport system permease protein